MTNRRRWAAFAVSAALGVSLLPSTSVRFTQPAAGAAPLSPAPLLQAAAAVVETATPEEENPLLVPEATAGVSGTSQGSAEVERALADELARLKTRDAEELVSVVTQSNVAGAPFGNAYLLAIAFAETHGKVLAVSPAGAAGLAQATPAAYLMEGLGGKVYITTDYLVGTRAYIMKKPLGDALSIARKVAARNTPANRREGLRLVQRAKELRRTGIEELEALDPHAPDIFMQRVEAADRHNLKVLDELETLLERKASSKKLRAFGTRVQKEYSRLMKVQQVTWKRYARDLEKQRNAVLRREFREDPVRVIQTRPYEAGEVLARELDARFSPTEMVRFLSAHLGTKQEQAIALGVPEHEVEQWTAALYNGGLVNVSRLRAGLLGSLRETENYMKKVPAMKERLESAVATAGS